MSTIEIFWGFAPILALLIIVVFFVAKHALSKPHRLNKREPGPYHFGGPWNDYRFDKSFGESEGHPDEVWDIDNLSRETKKPGRKKRPRRKK